MPLLYRSPNVRIDAHDWHIVVHTNPRSGRTITAYRFRLAGSLVAWRPLTSWPGKLPKGLRSYFEFTRRSIEIARGAPAGTSKAWRAAAPRPEARAAL